MRKKRVFIVLGFALAVIFILGLVIGSVAMPLEETGKILANELFGAEFPVSEARTNILFNIRFPRVLLSMLTGMGFAVSGAVIQGVYKNPMAELVRLYLRSKPI